MKICLANMPPRPALCSIFVEACLSIDSFLNRGAFVRGSFNRSTRTGLCLVLAASALAACGEGGKAANAGSGENRVSESAPPSPQLKQLFTESDEAMLKRNPLAGIFRGDLRFHEYL